MTLNQSSAVQIQALVLADEFLTGSSSKPRHLITNLASVPSGQLVNSPTEQSLGRNMQWQTLYSNQRTGSAARSTGSNETLRTSYVRDYDRLIFSSAFRRLQNKTQVFPLPGAVFVHNRLTHSLEVASVGRSLGKAVGDALADAYPREGQAFQEFYRYELPNVIAAGCLAHDIGNPPFGHSGEDAIRHFFHELSGPAKARFEEALTVNQQRDFLYFEGNANAFRTLTHAFNEPRPGGFNLTYSTLASIIKYPTDSLNGFNKGQLVTKKSGFFDSEIDTYKQLAETLGIPKQEANREVYARHPFVYLVEAADDICYRIIDFEDAHRLNIIDYKTLEELFLAFFEKESGYDSLSYLGETLAQIRDDNQKVQFLRAKLINLLIHRAKDIFMQHEAALLSGNLSKSLMDYLPAHELAVMKKIDAFSVAHIYNHRSVIEIEIAGYHVMGELLKAFVGAVLQPKLAKSKKLLQLISPQFLIQLEANSFYGDLQSVVDFIAGMTDLYAVDTYKKITGLNL